MPIERKPAKISNQQFLNALRGTRQKKLAIDGITWKARKVTHTLQEIQPMVEKRLIAE